MKEKISRWIDDKIYWLFYHRWQKRMIQEPGMVYLMKLHIDSWLERNPIDERLKESTDLFYEQIKKLKEKGPQ